MEGSFEWLLTDVYMIRSRWTSAFNLNLSLLHLFVWW